MLFALHCPPKGTGPRRHSYRTLSKSRLKTLKNLEADNPSFFNIALNFCERQVKKR
jgi:hypothetical protein